MSTYIERVVAPNDRASAIAHRVNVASRGYCPAVVVHQLAGHGFRGPVGYAYRPELLREMADGLFVQNGHVTAWTLLETGGADGGGEKGQLATLLGTPAAFRLRGQDVMAMAADDVSRDGGLPCFAYNVVDVRGITEQNLQLFEALMEGYNQALAYAHVVSVKGETALHGHGVGAFCLIRDPRDQEQQLPFSWSVTCTGLLRRTHSIDGSAIRPGQPIVGLVDPGIRCTGGSELIELLLATCSGNVQMLRDTSLRDFITRLLEPAVIYSPTITRLIGWNPDGSADAPLALITGIAHVTGGGPLVRLGELLPTGVGALLDRWHASSVLLEVQRLSQRTTNGRVLTDERMAHTFHCGYGMLVVVESDGDAQTVIGEAERDGIGASVVGCTTSSPVGRIEFHSPYLNGTTITTPDRI